MYWIWIDNHGHNNQCHDNELFLLLLVVPNVALKFDSRLIRSVHNLNASPIVCNLLWVSTDWIDIASIVFFLCAPITASNIFACPFTVETCSRHLTDSNCCCGSSSSSNSSSNSRIS